MRFELGRRVPLFDELWHAGTVVGIRRPPNPGDDRTFVRVAFTDHVELEVQAGTLTLMGRSAVDRMALCPVCFPSWSDAASAGHRTSPIAAPGADDAVT